MTPIVGERDGDPTLLELVRVEGESRLSSRLEACATVASVSVYDSIKNDCRTDLLLELDKSRSTSVPIRIKSHADVLDLSVLIAGYAIARVQFGCQVASI
jgi:hypothetical protein